MYATPSNVITTSNASASESQSGQDDLLRSPSLGAKVISASVTLLFLQLIVFGHRMYTRRYISKSIRLDDYLMICVAAISCSITALTAVQFHFGLGHHLKDVSMEGLHMIMKINAPLGILYQLTCNFTRLSILAYYNRVYAENYKTFARIVKGTFLLFLLMGCTQAIVQGLQCIPFRQSWTLTKIPGAHCLNIKALSFSYSTINIIANFWVLILPLSVLYREDMACVERFCIMLILFIGLGSSICSIFRFKFLIDNYNNKFADYTWTTTTMALFSMIERNLGAIAGNLPVLKELLHNRKPNFLSTSWKDVNRSSLKESQKLSESLGLDVVGKGSDSGSTASGGTRDIGLETAGAEHDSRGKNNVTTLERSREDV